MKQVLDSGRTGRREKTPKCGHCECQKKVRVAKMDSKMDSKRWPKTLQNGAKMRPRHEKM